jgi:hypothetical protein
MVSFREAMGRQDSQAIIVVALTAPKEKIKKDRQSDKRSGSGRDERNEEITGSNTEPAG